MIFKTVLVKATAKCNSSIKSTIHKYLPFQGSSKDPHLNMKEEMILKNINLIFSFRRISWFGKLISGASNSSEFPRVRTGHVTRTFQLDFGGEYF